MALTQDRETLKRDGRAFMLPVAANAMIFCTSGWRTTSLPEKA